MSQEGVSAVGGEAVRVLLSIVDAYVVAAAIVVVIATAHAKRLVACKFNTHGLRGTVTGAAVFNGTEAAFYGAVTGRSRRTVGGVAAAVADLGFTSCEECGDGYEEDQPERARAKGSEEKCSLTLLSHRVSVSAERAGLSS